MLKNIAALVLILIFPSLAFSSLTVLSVPDGYIDLNQRIFVDIETDAIREQLIKSKSTCTEDLVVRTQVYGFLVTINHDLILVDTGCGTSYGPNLGHLINNLLKVGCDLNNISLVLITHLHPDHIGGLLTPEGTPTFPEATICVSSVDAQYWSDPAQEAIADDFNRPFFALARKILEPYKSLGKLRLIKPEETIISGVKSIDASGHTPGHMAFLFSSGIDHLLLWGDLVHSSDIQFAKPDWFVSFDVDGPMAVSSRRALFTKAADQKLIVGGSHLSHYGIGFVSRVDDVFAWEPFIYD